VDHTVTRSGDVMAFAFVYSRSMAAEDILFLDLEA
jgi:hypothetical protein